MLIFVLLGLLMTSIVDGVSPASDSTVAPLAAPAEFSSSQYGLTFHTPVASTYCPLPTEWVGSDHGTTVFLESPTHCGGAGYPSTSRAFEPDDVARIDLFYSYRSGDDELPAPPCQRVDTLIFLGAQADVCEERRGALVSRSVIARYSADVPAQAILTLTTREERLTADMATFRRTAATFRTCSSVLRGPKGRFTIGVGAPCPKASFWF